MKLLLLIFRVLVTTYFSSADPNLFGSRRRRIAKEGIANEYKSMAQGTQDQIDQVQSENPFESAGAKAAMARASSGAKQMQARMLNTMGSGATAEAIVGAQGATNQALGSAVGEIAAGAEANKSNKLHSLQSQKNQQMGMYGGMGSSAAGEYGSGWGTALQVIDTMGKIAKGGADAAGALMGGGGGAAAAAAGSDRRLKDNIKKIGEIQGHCIYKFNYKGDTKTIIGVIAQELENTESSDCIVPVGDYLYVDYDKLFKEV